MAPTNTSESGQKKSKNQLRRERAKLLKQKANSISAIPTIDPHVSATNLPVIEPKENNKVDNSAKIAKPKSKGKPRKSKLDIPVVDLDAKKPLTEEELTSLQETYKSIFDKFDKTEDEINNDTNKQLIPSENNVVVIVSDQDDVDDDNVENANKEFNEEKVDENYNLTKDNLSKRKFKKLYSIPLSVLKSEAKYPELIDWKDANSPDPRLYIYLKSLPNSVYVPSHWQSKKSFLSSKRGIERPPFKLPQFILDTGILEMRNTNDEVENESTLKQRMRERVQPKSGQLDIDYEKLHDAFFKYQQKPPLMKFGELYTETSNNDEVELKFKVSHMKIGVLSNKLKYALGMIGENNLVKNRLPPWFYKMQELGPPPSYPYMKIDKNGKISFNNPNELNIGPPIVTKHWGTLVNDLDDNDDIQLPKDEQDSSVKKESIGYDRAKGDVLLNTFGEDPTKSKSYIKNPVTSSSSNDKRRQLYSVLSTSSTGGTNSIFGSQTTSYKIPPQ
ncbi:hypothetical protein C6P42_004041 [Pichia californica]|nr:hypothetical protein C6P42_004041 [[Candida] californica]